MSSEHNSVKKKTLELNSRSNLFSAGLISPQFGIYISNSKANTLLFFLLKKCENPLHCNAKDSHIFSTKNNGVFVILPFEILMNDSLTNDMVNFEQLAPGVWTCIQGLSILALFQ